MVFLRVSCSFMILLILQLHAKVSAISNSNSKEMVFPQDANRGVLESTIKKFNTNKNVMEVMRSRKLLEGEKHAEANTTREMEKIEESVRRGRGRRRRNNGPKELKTASLTADYSEPFHHPPRHN